MAYVLLGILAVILVAGTTLGIVLAGVGIIADIFVFAVKCGLVAAPIAVAWVLARALFGF